MQVLIIDSMVMRKSHCVRTRMMVQSRFPCDMEHPPFAAGFDVFIDLYRCNFSLPGSGQIFLVRNLWTVLTLMWVME